MTDWALIKAEDAPKLDLSEKQKKMRYIERQFEWVAEEWQMNMLEHFDQPIKIYSWFKNVVLDREKRTLTAPYEQAGKWIYDNYRFNLIKAGYRGFNLRFPQKIGGKMFMVTTPVNPEEEEKQRKQRMEEAYLRNGGVSPVKSAYKKK